MFTGRQPYIRGKVAEYKLLNILKKRGWYCIRGAASGRRGQKVKYPDLLAIKDRNILIFEVKSRKHRDTIHIEKSKYGFLKWVEKVTGGIAYIAVYVTNDSKWYFFRLDDLINEGDKYAIFVRMYDKALTLDDITKIEEPEKDDYIDFDQYE